MYSKKTKSEYLELRDRCGTLSRYTMVRFLSCSAPLMEMVHHDEGTSGRGRRAEIHLQQWHESARHAQSATYLAQMIGALGGQAVCFENIRLEVIWRVRAKTQATFPIRQELSSEKGQSIDEEP